MDSETSADIPKYEPEIIERAGLHVRLTRAHHDKLAMLVRETGRSSVDRQIQGSCIHRITGGVASRFFSGVLQPPPP